MRSANMAWMCCASVLWFGTPGGPSAATRLFRNQALLSGPPMRSPHCNGPFFAASHREAAPSSSDSMRSLRPARGSSCARRRLSAPALP